MPTPTRRGIALLWLSCTGACLGGPAGAPHGPASNGVAWPGATWPQSTLAAEGLDGAAVDGLLAAIEAGRFGLVDHFLLIRHGREVANQRFEHDYQKIAAPHRPANHQYDYDHPDWHPYYRGTSLHTLQSVTKSIASICIGIAIDEGHIPGGVQTPAMSFFASYDPDLSDPRRRAMTLEDC